VFVSQTDVCRLYIAHIRTRGVVGKLWKAGFKFAFGRNTKGKVFGFRNQLKKLHKTKLLAVRNELL